MQEIGNTKYDEGQDVSLLKEIRDNFRFARNYWADIYKEGDIDIRYASGDSWDSRDRMRRIDLGRPVLCHDQLGQYCNLVINNIRQARRAVKIDPKGNGASEQTAEARQNIIRAIEYKWKAQQAYICAAENMIQRSFGFVRVNLAYVSDRSNLLEIIPRPVNDPCSIYLDPAAKEYDYSDGGWAFEFDLMRRDDYKRKWPNSVITSFAADQYATAPDWISEDFVQVAGYWKVEKSQAKLFRDPRSGSLVRSDEIEDSSGLEVVRDDLETRSIVQYITNGLEILETNEWQGHYIPLCPWWGKRIYVNEGGQQKLRIESLIRRARDPQQQYNYIKSTQNELIGMTPKAPWQAAEGQIAGHEEEYQKAGSEPIAVLQHKVTVDGAPGVELPPPSRIVYIPPLDQLEIAAQSAKADIQAAMGAVRAGPASNGPVSGGNKVLSGAAVQELAGQEDLGSFHFTDNHIASLEHVGRIYDDLITEVYVEPREVQMRKMNDDHFIGQVNQPGQPSLVEGDHDVTVSTGPSYQSQRAEVADFIGQLITPEVLQLAIAQPQSTAAKILATAIKMRDMGPRGDELAEIIEPQPGDPQQLQAVVMQLQQHNQQLIQALQQSSQIIEMKQVEARNKLDVEKMKLDADSARWKAEQETKLAIAEISTKAQVEIERVKTVNQTWSDLHNAAHESALSAQEHQQGIVAANQMPQVQQDSAQPEPVSQT